MNTVRSLLSVAAVVASIMAPSGAFGGDAYQEMGKQLPRGYERVVVDGSSFDIGYGETKKLRIPFGPRDLETMFIQANTNGCNIADIQVTAISEDRSTQQAILEVQNRQSWFFVKYKQERVKELEVTHKCGTSVRVQAIHVDVSQHAVDCVFDNCPQPCLTEELCPTEELEQPCKFSVDDLKEKVLRNMPKSDKYYYLSETMNRLLNHAIQYLELGAPETRFIKALKTAAFASSRSALVNHDGSSKTLAELKKLRVAMISSDPFIEKLAMTPATENWAQAFWVVGEIIDREADFYFSEQECAELKEAIAAQLQEQAVAPRPRAVQRKQKQSKVEEVVPLEESDESSDR